MSKRIVYVDLTKKQRERLKAVKPVVLAAMDKAALDRTLAAGQKLIEAERREDAELLAAAKGCFPELRRRASASLPPPVQPVASVHRAGWYRRMNGAPVKKNPSETYSSPFVDQRGNKLPTGPAPFPAGLEV